MSNRRTLTARDMPTAKGQCRACGAPVPKGRQTSCGRSCSERIRALCFTHEQARLVCARDRGICAACGCDTAKVKRIMRHVRHWLYRWHIRARFGRSICREIAREWGFTGSREYEIDHVTPVCEGGGVRRDMTVEDVLANLRTLCVPCHRDATRELSRRRAEAKRAAKATLFGG